MKKVIIIGASSGMGEAMAKQLSEKGIVLGLAARRLDKLQALAAILPGVEMVKTMDVEDADSARLVLGEMLHEMQDVDTIILNAGVGNDTQDWPSEKQVITINALGFAALINYAFHYFREKDGGHIVGISSVAAVRGHRMALAYSSTKALMSSYMEGLRHYCIKNKIPVVITDIRPGFVQTAMTENAENMFWMSSAEKAARQIITAIQKKRKIRYVSKRWALMARVMYYMPRWMYYKT